MEKITKETGLDSQAADCDHPWHADDVEGWVSNRCQINVSFVPKNTTQRNVTYRSTDTSIATVSDTGYVEAYRSGICDIIITSVSNPSVSTSVRIYVTYGEDTMDEVVPVERITTNYAGYHLRLPVTIT